MNESSKSQARRISEGFFQKYCQGKGLDIGAGGDPLPNAQGWDLQDGDAQELEGLPNEEFDFVYSSHCLEHMRDPKAALQRWWSVLKPGGYLLIAVPDSKLYEQGVWPSIFNPDHKWTFSISRFHPPTPCHLNLLDLIKTLHSHEVIYMKIIDEGYDYEKMGNQELEDQTLGVAEAAIEMVIHKEVSPLPSRSPLKDTIVCPRCKDRQWRMEGKTPTSHIHALCLNCGLRVEVPLS